MNAKFELQEIEQNVIVQAFSQVGGTQQLVARIAEEARKHVPDVTTKKGRDAIGSNAMKVSKSKTLISKLGKDLVAEEKARIKLVDADRIQAEKELDALRDEILAPRDAWEQAERDRVAKHENAITEIKGFANNDFLITANSSMIEGAIAALNDQVIDSSFEEYEGQAKLAKFEALETLRNSLTETQALEAEQAELERLRIAEQAQIQAERDAQIAREATEKAQREAEEKARFEAEKVQREKAESEQREARLLAEKEAAELREQALKQKAIDDAKQAEIAKQQAIEAERQRIEAEQFAQAEAERKALAEREANVAHKKQICGEALQGLIDLGISAERGRDILNAINKGLVPHVSIKF